MRNGALFRQLRQNHHLTLQQVADQVNSVAAVSKFERGLSDMGLSRFLHLLDRIDVSMEEFLFRKTLADKQARVSSETEHDFNSQIDMQFESYVLSLGVLTAGHPTDADMQQLQSAIDRLRQPQGRAATNRERFSIIVLEFYQLTLQGNINHRRNGNRADVASLARLTSQYHELVRPFVRYLFNVERWGYFELYYFGLLHTAIDNATEHQLLPLALKRTRKDQGFNSISTLRFRLLFGVFTDFINARQFTWAKDALNQVAADLKRVHDLGMANQLLFCRGWYQIIHADVPAGMAKCQRAVSIEQTVQQDNRGTSNLRDVLPYIMRNLQDPGHGAYFM